MVASMAGLLAQTGQQRDELVATVAEAGVFRAEHALHQAANLGEQAAADQVAVGVVDLLEVVEVDEQQAELVAAIGCRDRDLFVQQGVEVARVEEAGAVVGDGELVDQLDRARVLDGDGGVVAENAEEGDGVLAHQVELAVEELDDAESLVSGADRDAGDGLDVQLGMCAEKALHCVSRETSGTTSGLPVAATQPATPSPIGMRRSFRLSCVFADSDGIVELLGLARPPSAWTSARARRTGPSFP